jgi:hypothetical protein
MNLSLRRISNAPGRRIINAQVDGIINAQVDGGEIEDGTQEDERSEHVVTLGKLPRTLHAVWMEYEIGCAGNKPAKEFTSKERGGKNKYSFYLRKFLWDQVSEMVRSGMDANDACERIYAVYGQFNSVTKILRALQRNKRTGGHPNLHICHH